MSLNIPKESHFLSLMFIPYKTHATGNKKSINKIFETIPGNGWCGTQIYYITPKGAQILLKNALPIANPIDNYISYVSHNNENFNSYKVKRNPYSKREFWKDFYNTSIQGDVVLKKALPQDNWFYGLFLGAIPILFIILFIWILVLIVKLNRC